MKRFYKTTSYSFLFVLMLSCITWHANAQLQPNLPKANFTSFTQPKKYEDVSKITDLTPAKFREHPDFGVRVNDHAQWYEQIDKRTLNTRTFIGPKNEIITENAYDNINFIDEKGWMRAADIKLKPSLGGWSAEQQEMPVYLYNDASTALTIGHNTTMIFNKNVHLNQQNISVNNFTVGDNGMYLKNVAPYIDKTIQFGRGSIESNYSIQQPIKLNSNLDISEDIILPPGYVITENTDPSVDSKGELVVISPDGKQVAELRAPFCYDNQHQNSTTGTYHYQKQLNGYRLDIEVPASWLNNPLLQYPVTIDPLIIGNLTAWTGGKIPSCFTPNYGSGTITCTVPAGIMITHFFLQSCYYCPIISKKYASINFVTSCSSSGWLTVPDTTKLPGVAYGSGDYYDLTCCLKPSCSVTTLNLTMEITRDSGGTSCDSTQYAWYDPYWASYFGYTFEAYVAGRTVQDSTWSVTPTSLCSNQCSLTANALVYFGVPPYTIKEDTNWTKDTASFGTHFACVGSKGKASLSLTIPNCPGPSCKDTTLYVPAVIITDACKNKVVGLPKLPVTHTAVPDVTVTPDTEKVCSGTNVNLTLSSCVSGSTYSWTGSDGSSGTTNIIGDAPNNHGASAITVNYTVTPSGNGCTGDATTFPVTITPFTIAVSPTSPELCNGESVALSVTGDATDYAWTPSAGLSCTSCSNPTANPSSTTTYIVAGSNGGACSAFDSITVVVNPLPTISLSKDTTIDLGNSVQLTATTNNADSVTWVPSAGLSCTNCFNPVATPTVTTTYKATAFLGPCTATSEVTIHIIVPCETIRVPSGFTPNGDGINDYLHVLNSGQVSLQVFRVYNRWGEKMYETTNINDKGWDGTYNGKAQPVGTYVYYAAVNCQGKVVSIKGDVDLIR